MKGQIPLIEAIIASIALFIAFNMMISVGEYQTRWKEAVSSLEGRDILITADRLGKLHEYSFSQDFKTEFLGKINAVKDDVVKYETQGTIKNTTYIACECTNDQIAYLQNILSDVKFNKRIVDVDICSTTLPNVNPCTSSQQYPDLLIIWGYKNLVPYTDVFTNLKNNGVGILEIADLLESQIDTAQQTIFGLKWFTNSPFSSTQDEFLKPRNVSFPTYQSYKWFHHLPYLLKGSVSETIPIEGIIVPCPISGKKGEFKFNDINHRFWICGTTAVYWDTTNNNIADKIAIPRKEFSIGTSKFFLNYIDDTDRMRVSFKPDYKFNDFLVKDNNHNKLFPIDEDKSKVLISMAHWDLLREKPVSAVIFNGTKNAKTVWMADFARGPTGLTDSGDDHKQLLASLVLSISNKKTKETLQQIGEITSYINVNNIDILEIYKVDLSIGKPF